MIVTTLTSIVSDSEGIRDELLATQDQTNVALALIESTQLTYSEALEKLSTPALVNRIETL